MRAWNKMTGSGRWLAAVALFGGVLTSCAERIEPNTEMETSEASQASKVVEGECSCPTNPNVDFIFNCAGAGLRIAQQRCNAECSVACACGDCMLVGP